jgi:hypothetical protein
MTKNDFKSAQDLVTVIFIFKQVLDCVIYITGFLPNIRLKDLGEIQCKVNSDNFRI